MSMLKSIKIPTKIFGGFGIILALLLIISATGAINLFNGNNSFSQYRESARHSNQAAQVQSQLLESRMAAVKYTNNPSDALAKTVEQNIAETLAANQALGKLVTDPATKESIASTERDLRSYGEGFKAITELQNRRAAISTSLGKAGEEIEGNLTRIMETANADGDAEATYWAGMLLRDFLMVRLYSTKFLLDNSEKDYSEMVKETAAMREHHKNLLSSLQNPQRRALARNVRAELDNYDGSANELHDIAVEDSRINSGVLKTVGPKVTDAMEKIKAAVEQKQQILGPQASAAMETATYMTVAIAIASLVIGALAAWLIGSSISRPIRAITEAMNTLAGGDKTIDIPGKDHKDEIGLMANAVQVFKDNMIRNDEMTANEAAQAKERQQRAQRIEELTSAFDAGVSELLNAVASASTEMESTATSMAGIANDTNQRATTVASASEQASANVQTVAAATDELNSSVQEISRQVTLSSEIAGRAATQAETTDAQVRGLADAAQRIGEVVSLISAIAEQTNLLALNATIEAARAGDAGKGFAVVAAEVKELATQTGKATEDIGQQITAIQSETAEAVNAIQSIGSIIREVNEIAASIASAVEEQSAATGEIARNVEQAATGTQEVTSNIMEVTQSANETGAAATQVTSVAADLSQKSDQLKHQVECFLSDVRSA